MKNSVKRIHLIGIGGSGMSGIAEVLINSGYKVTGSDIEYSRTIKKIESIGGEVFIGHSPDNLKGAEIVVYSTAIRENNTELMDARDRKLTVLRRAEMLSELLSLKKGIAIAGSHGKTTATSMIASIFGEAGGDPTFVVGGKVFGLDMHSKVGKGEFMVVEADESDGSFLKLKPDYCVVTNIDYEHLSYYDGMENLKTAFVDFINNISPLGLAVLCVDNPILRSLFTKINKKYFTYGIEQKADYYALNIALERDSSSFDAYYGRRLIGKFNLFVPGIHNVLNALSAIALSLELGIKTEFIQEALRCFHGVERRFQIKKSDDRLIIVDDYAHHPVEIAATLKAAKNWNRHIIAVFQPHRYSRMKDLMEGFVNSLKLADSVIITDIYSAGELEIDGVSSMALSERMRREGYKNVYYVPDKKDIKSNLRNILKGGEMVIFLGAGDITKSCDDFVHSRAKGEKTSEAYYEEVDAVNGKAVCDKIVSLK
ncbi:UDP-N-acetylmuramate--L-alanine ligase [Candidatus Acidulodesulfobacterium sp. H_13]|uniref:UDP-N-acetylmuramate--L-alanine ligase n=1 Tax=Candidatus Acidulodesulfobacterium sp. H_13 TaxID=3395470 RepID=UPI003AF82A9F